MGFIDECFDVVFDTANKCTGEGKNNSKDTGVRFLNIFVLYMGLSLVAAVVFDVISFQFIGILIGMVVLLCICKGNMWLFMLVLFGLMWLFSIF